MSTTSTESGYRSADAERRSAQDAAYAARALELLDRDDPGLGWLFHAGQHRQKVLIQLGRIAAADGADACRVAARELCTEAPDTTETAARTLRERRIGVRVRAGTPPSDALAPPPPAAPPRGAVDPGFRRAVIDAGDRYFESTTFTSYAIVAATFRELADHFDEVAARSAA